MTDLAFVFDRSILIHATPETVFRYFTDSARWARWWGEGSAIDPRPAGEILIRYPGGVVVRGEVVEVVPDERIVFTYGYASGEPIPAGASRVTIRLEAEPMGTRLSLRHALPDAASRDAHGPGWRYQLAVFANLVAGDAHGNGLDERVDRYFAAWAETDPAARLAALEATTSDDVGFRDRFGCVSGRDELTAHIGAVQMHMPGARIERDGGARHCQGVALVDWKSVGDDAADRGRGTNVFTLAPDGRFHDVVGVWHD